MEDQKRGESEGTEKKMAEQKTRESEGSEKKMAGRKQGGYKGTVSRHQEKVAVEQ